MKNLMLYINPRKGFDAEHARYAEIQIDNTLRYWDKGDLIFVTNFPYKYHGVKTTEVSDDLFCAHHDTASKVNVIVHLLEQGLDDLTWYHDMEAWQTAPLDLKLDRELGLTDYGWKPDWNTGSFFFQPTTLDVFRRLQDISNQRVVHEEWVLNRIAGGFEDRIQRLNITYNFGKRHREENLQRADKPIRVAHFHPYRENLLRKFKPIIPDYLYRMMKERAQ